MEQYQCIFNHDVYGVNNFEVLEIWQLWFIACMTYSVEKCHHFFVVTRNFKKNFSTLSSWSIYFKVLWSERKKCKNDILFKGSMYCCLFYTLERKKYVFIKGNNSSFKCNFNAASSAQVIEWLGGPTVTSHQWSPMFRSQSRFFVECVEFAWSPITAQRYECVCLCSWGLNCLGRFSG